MISPTDPTAGNEMLSRWHGNIRLFLVPSIAIVIGIGVLAADAYFQSQKQQDKYALPDDRSSQSLLDFMREMDGSFQSPSNFMEASNSQEVSTAIMRAYETMPDNMDGLTSRDRREADFLYIIYAGTCLYESNGDKSELLNRLMRKALEFLRNADEFTTQEKDVALGIMLVLERLGRYDDQLEFVKETLEELKRFPDIVEAQTLANSFEGITQRLGLLSQELDLQSTTLDGDEFELADLRGKIVLIEFYGTRCIPCIRDLPALRRIYSQYKDAGFEIIGVCLNAPAAKVKTFVQDHQLPWIQLCHNISASRNCNQELSERFGVQAVPTTVLVDSNGKVIRLGVRPLSSNSEQDLESVLQEALIP